MSGCKHEFHFNIACAMFNDKPGNGALNITGHCRHCKVPVVFHGPRGASAPYPVVGVDRLELRVPVTFGYQAKFEPGPALLIHGEEVVPSEGDFQS